jgi:hypothetical protein
MCYWGIKVPGQLGQHWMGRGVCADVPHHSSSVAPCLSCCGALIRHPTHSSTAIIELHVCICLSCRCMLPTCTLCCRCPCASAQLTAQLLLLLLQLLPSPPPAAVRAIVLLPSALLSSTACHASICAAVAAGSFGWRTCQDDYSVMGGVCGSSEPK